MYPIALFIAILMLMVIPIDGTSITNRNVTCPEDYSSCSCEENSKGSLAVICQHISVAELKAVFNRTKARDFASFSLTIGTNETSPIPNDLFGASRTKKLYIDCERPYQLIIEDNAFRSSKLLTNVFRIRNCDLKKQLNFQFLDGFQALTRLSIRRSKNFISFQGLPSLKLTHVTLSFSSGFEGLVEGPNIALPSLNHLILSHNDMDDVLASKILTIFTESSKNSLKNLELNNNKLTRIPEVISSFTNLIRLRLERNAITSIKTKTFDFSNESLMKFFYFEENYISSIEPNAFRGLNYSEEVSYFVIMEKNNLTRLDSYVFLPLLEGISQGGGGLALSENPINCDCHLAWLVVHNRKLLWDLAEGVCSDSTNLKDLDPKKFTDCPVFTCPVDMDGNFLNPISCSSYYACSAGKSTLVQCPEGQVFSPDNQICVYCQKAYQHAKHKVISRCELQCTD